MEDPAWDAVLHESLDRFWQSMSPLYAESRIPRLSDIDLLAMPGHARDTVILDLGPDSGRFKIRYAGSQVVELLNDEPTGRYADELDIGPSLGMLLDSYRHVAASGTAYRIRAPLWIDADISLDVPRKKVMVEQLACPLLGKTDEIAHVIAEWAQIGQGPFDAGFRARPLEIEKRRRKSRVRNPPPGRLRHTLQRRTGAALRTLKPA